MKGTMQSWLLRQNTILDHANKHHPQREIVSKLVEGKVHRTNYAEIHLRARKLSQAFVKLGVKRGDVIGTMAWNTHRHIESWYGITGAGGVYHTLNPRLFPEQLVYIADHARRPVDSIGHDLPRNSRGHSRQATEGEGLYSYVRQGEHAADQTKERFML